MRWMRRTLLLLAFVFAVLGVHPCDSAPADPAANHAAHHHTAHHHKAHHHAAPGVPAADDSPDAPDDCMGGACDETAAFEREAPPAVSDDLVELNPSPLGSAAPGSAPGHLHSGQSPGAGPGHAPDLTLLSVSRT